MQEQVPSRMTPEQGWSQMKVILDREMPVNRRSRRMLFLWRSLIAVGILTTFSFIMWDTANTMQPGRPQPSPSSPTQEQPATPAPVEEKATKEQPVNFADASQDTDFQRETGKHLSSSPELESIQNANRNSTQTNSAHSNQSAVTNSKSVASGHDVHTSGETNVSSPGSNNYDSGSVMSDSPAAVAMHDSDSNQEVLTENEQTDAASTASTTTSSASAQPYAVRNGQVTQGIPGLAVELLTVDSRTHDMLAIESSPIVTATTKRKKDLFGAHVHTGVMAAYHDGAAWQAGAGLSFKALPKLRVSAGGSYRTFSPDFRSGEKDPTESLDGYGSIIVQDETYLDEGVSNYVNDFSLSASTDYQAVEPLVKTIRQWQIDAGLSYDITRRLFIQAGASYALQTTAISAVPILADAMNYNPSNPRFARALEDYNLIREHMLSVNGGIGYHLNNRLDIYAQIDHSINPYLESEPVSFESGASASIDRTDYIRGVTLGIKYRWL